MNNFCPLHDSNACQHTARKGVCQDCHFDFETLDPDEGMFRLRRVNAESVFAQHQKTEAEKQKASANEARFVKLEAELEQAKHEAALSRAQAEKALAEAEALRSRPSPPSPEPKAASPTYYTLIRADGSPIPRSAEPEMIAIPDGRYLRGSPATEFGRYNSEGPQMEVNIPAFEIGVAPVTVGQWKQYVAENSIKEFWGSTTITVHSPEKWAAQTDEHPVVRVSWNDAQAYVAWLNERAESKTGRFRLPSEVEWEYTARAGTKTPFNFGNTINTDQANFDGSNNHYRGTNSGDYRQCTTPVKTFKPNDFGLYDVHGNVWEWCEDVWHDNYEDAPADGSVWSRGGNQDKRVLRGGSWGSFARDVRAASRDSGTPDNRSYHAGFRLARTVF